MAVPEQFSALFGQLENLLAEQADRAFTELLFPGQIESHGITNGPRKWHQMPSNYQKALNLGFRKPTNDSSYVYLWAQRLVGLRSTDVRLLAARRQLRWGIQSLVNVLQNLGYQYTSLSVKEIVYAEVFECRLHSMNDEAWIDKDVADVVAQLIHEMDLDMETLLDTAVRVSTSDDQRIEPNSTRHAPK